MSEQEPILEEVRISSSQFFYAGVKIEQERIIKLLFEDIDQTNGGKWVWSCDGYSAEFDKDALKALIKGEQE